MFSRPLKGPTRGVRSSYEHTRSLLLRKKYVLWRCALVCVRFEVRALEALGMLTLTRPRDFFSVLVIGLKTLFLTVRQRLCPLKLFARYRLPALMSAYSARRQPTLAWRTATLLPRPSGLAAAPRSLPRSDLGSSRTISPRSRRDLRVLGCCLRGGGGGGADRRRGGSEDCVPRLCAEIASESTPESAPRDSERFGGRVFFLFHTGEVAAISSRARYGAALRSRRSMTRASVCETYRTVTALHHKR